MLFLMLMLGTVSAVMAQGVDVPVTDYDAMIGTFAGFVSDVQWYIALLYGFGASLVANGIADTGLVQWLIGLIVKKSESKS